MAHQRMDDAGWHVGTEYGGLSERLRPDQRRRRRRQQAWLPPLDRARTAFRRDADGPEHPEWVIGPVPSGQRTRVNYMVNLGIPKARRHIHRPGIESDHRRRDHLLPPGHFNDLRVPELFAMADAPDGSG